MIEKYKIEDFIQDHVIHGIKSKKENEKYKYIKIENEESNHHYTNQYYDSIIIWMRDI